MTTKISLIIPVYNEGQHLNGFFEQLFAISFEYPVEYVIVDDCSTDDSWSVIEPLGKRDDVLVHRNAVNMGKGASLREGFRLATGDIITVQDADFEYDPNDLNRLIEPIAQNRADVVYGSRFRADGPQVHRTFHYLVNRFLTLLSNALSGLYLTDMETCYKVFRADVIKPLTQGFSANRFGFEPEVTAAVAKLKLRVHEYPISYYPRGYLEGKKINWKDGIAAVWFILKYNLSGLTPSVKNAIPEKYHLTHGRLL